MEETKEENTESNNEDTKDESAAKEESRQGKTWYPYITKSQFDKFLARLDTKVPEQIDRDYVRAIIRTPSMIYRFLRGIEAMKLIDKDQQPTPLLNRVLDKQTRSHALAEVQRDLYKDLLEKQEENGEMNDEEIVEYFRDRTGMGRDSANKMKMFFKYLNNEADFSAPTTKPGNSKEKEPTSRSQKKEIKTTTTKEETAAPHRSTSRGKQTERNNRESRDQQRTNDSTQQQASPSYRDRPPRPLNEQQKAYLDTVRSVVNINVDGDWDEDMMRVAFDRLERLLDRIRRM
ncbi:MAG: DUF5343 domain-containing protein [Candidatus Latescibacterota bacterium]|nr:DUF5343 domain-containing protein [Candidatus Latescibacterota bacterium]